MLKLIRYRSGESRVVDEGRMLASQFLRRDEMDEPLGDYELDCSIERSDLTEPHFVLRDDSGAYCRTCAVVAREGGPSHNGSPNCESGSIASGGTVAHCACDVCF